MLDQRGYLGLRWSMLVRAVYDDACGAMVICLCHLPLVERHPFSGGTLPAISPYGVRSLLILKLLLGAEMRGVVRHVKHGAVFQRPRPCFLTVGAADQCLSSAFPRMVWRIMSIRSLRGEM